MPDRIAIVTHAGLPRLSADDRLLLSALPAWGLEGEPVIWDSPGVRWERYSAVILRSCWDYHLRLFDFLGWVDDLERAEVPLWNAPRVLRWNAHKSYLRDLAAAGIPAVPTRWAGPAAQESLADILRGAGWTDAVVKPPVSASAHETWRTCPARVASDEPRFQALKRKGGAMVQPFVPEIVSAGEWSLVFLGGAFSHAVLKRPKPGDFRVQAEHGGTTLAASPGPQLIAQAERALRVVPGPAPLYARVDGCVVDGRLWVIELELLEPSLFLTDDPVAPSRFAAAIASVVQQGPAGSRFAQVLSRPAVGPRRTWT